MNWLDFEDGKVKVKIAATARSYIWLSYCCRRRHIHVDACASKYHLVLQERPAVADKPARRLRNDCTVYVTCNGVVSCIASLPIDSLPMVSYYRPIVTLCLKCTVFEICRHIGRKSPKKTYPTLIWHVPLGWSLANFSTTHTLPETRIMGLSDQTVYISRSCFHSARHNTGVWQTYRRTRRCRKDRAMHSVAPVKMCFNISLLFLDVFKFKHRYLYD